MDLIGTENMSIRWVSMQASLIFPKVSQGLPCESVLCSPETLFPSTLPQGLGSCDVLVLELSDAHACFDPEHFRTLFQSLARPLTLVLAPGRREDQTMAWLNAGADRCLPRDIEASVIQAMIRSMLHRRMGLFATHTEHGLLRFEHDTHTLFFGSERIPLTQRETWVASLLFQQFRRHVRHEEILRTLCAEGKNACSPALVSLYIHRINKKIRPYGIQICFKRGYGYRLHADLGQQSSPPAVDWMGTYLQTGFQSINARQRLASHNHV